MATSCVRDQGFRSTHIDLKNALDYGLQERGSVFDILSPSGFACLCCIQLAGILLLHGKMNMCLSRMDICQSNHTEVSGAGFAAD